MGNTVNQNLFIIAEAGSNHEGDIGRARMLIDIAVNAGANAVKFQLIEPFKPEWIDELIAHSGKRIEFMATPFNQEGIKALVGKVKRWKIASPEASNILFREAVFRASGEDIVYISDGGIKTVLLFDHKNRIPLHCVSKYPAAELDYSLAQYKDYPGKWGISDHTTSTIVAVVAVCLGASVIEKHFTDDKTRTGPDHAFACNLGELTSYISVLRHTHAIATRRAKTTVKMYNDRIITWPISNS